MDYSGFTDNYTGGMINKEGLANFGPWVSFVTSLAQWWWLNCTAYDDECALFEK